MSTNEIGWVLIGLMVAAAVVLAGALVWRNARGKRERALRERFGPEYERLAEQYDDPRRVQRELEARAERVRHFQIHALSQSEHRRFSDAWQDTQQRFVDTPGAAVRSAHELVQQVMRARGYPVEDFEQCIADLSVDHATVVQHYRSAHALHEANRMDADTEQLRQAIVHYRALFAELLGTPAEARPDSRRWQPANA